MNTTTLISVSAQEAARTILTVEQLTDIAPTLVALFALGIAVWRIRIADKQAGTASQSLSNERFMSAVELLGHRNMAIRLGGVAALAEMARSQPKAYHLRVMEIFAAFLAYPPRQRGSDNTEEIDFHSADTVKNRRCHQQ